MYVMTEEDGLLVVIFTASHAACYTNAQEKVILCVEKKKDTAALNALQTVREILISALLSLTI